ncbi:hypothetical protein QA640_31920 [Bradyrhizobium sp. CB82]|uniref:hypothetical protein n=1 Tax=Bradyrhizobium sp. CB82 TaxID=3039159 RepID=UPI0024B0D9BA|nr:hypothetical protein [Bradyrhizobium sp. CB82]WFU38973.1 hypothetical protein QA640_31920 [Bradyrhizobium sp. CB82]
MKLQSTIRRAADRGNAVWRVGAGGCRAPKNKIIARGTDWQRCGLTAMVTINILDKPIERIRETCEMMGARDKFERALPELETFLEAEIARGETSEARLTYDGLCFLKEAFARK